MTRRVAILGVILSCACVSGPESDTVPELQTLTFEMMTKKKTVDDCVAGAEGCAYIRLDYPFIVEAPIGTAVEAVGQTVQAFLLRPLEEDEAGTTVTALMDQFTFDFMSFKKEFPDSAQFWFLGRKALVHYNAADVVSLSFTERSYMGGAHGIESIHFANLDPRSGAAITLADLLEPGSEDKLESIIEARFRAVREIEEGVSLADAGFTFENGEFELPDNFAIGEDALTFYYNPYEIAPYSMGATELVIPFEAIAELLERKSLED